MADAQQAVVMRGVVKRFPGVMANDGVDLEVWRGEIHALLGENGAGKTTLMNILYGIYHPDAGEIHVSGEHAVIRSPQDAIHLGIGMVHQQFRLVQTHTVTENVILGMGDGLLFREREARQRIKELAEKYSLQVDPEARVWQLSAGEQQRVEILKALYRGAAILILDEPTSMLTPSEIEELLKTLHRMTEEGHTIIFITHKLDEVTAVSHRVTVLRRGKVIATLETAQTNERELAHLMVGREVLFRLAKEPVKTGEAVLRVDDLHALSDKNLPALKGISLEVCAGEILGVAGVAGNGQREFVEALTGLRPVTGGFIFLKDSEITRTAPRVRIDSGMSCVPSERLTAFIPNMSIAENMILKTYRQAPISKGPLLDHKTVNAYADRLIQEYAVMTPSRETPVKLLSGGNIQRALLARELSTQPALLIAASPTSGLDVGATETVWKLLLEQRKQGRAVLLVSEDLDEVMTLSDRIAVLYEGEIMGIVHGEENNLEQIGLMMAGALRLPQEKWA
ncbi:MAG: ABC transporter ATP-binding protein [Chloroflexota bacterium]